MSQGEASVEAVRSAALHLLSMHEDQPRDCADDDDVYVEDVDRVRASDPWLRRFLEDADGDAQAAAQAVVHSLREQRRLQLRSLTQTCFPEDLWRLDCQRLLSARDGRPVLLLRLKYLRREAEVRAVVRALTAFHVWRLEQAVCDSQADGALLLLDWTGLAPAAFDLPSCLFVLSLRHVFPRLLRRLLLLRVPWFARPFAHAVRLAFRRSPCSVQLLGDVTSLREVIAPEQLPTYLGGCCPAPAVPVGAADTRSFARRTLGLSEEQAQRLLRLASQLLHAFPEDHAAPLPAPPVAVPPTPAREFLDCVINDKMHFRR